MNKDDFRKLKEDLTLLLMYMNRFTDKTRDIEGNLLHRAWKGYDFDDINNLEDKGFIFQTSKRAKSIYFTEEGLKRAEILMNEFTHSMND